jgi:hypothetical protein
MGRDKDQGKRKDIQSDEDASIEDHDRASDDDYSQPVRSKRPMPQDPPARALGHGRGDSGNPMLWKKMLTSGPKGSHARMKNASTGDEGGRFDDDIDLSLYTKMVVLIHPPEWTRKDPKLVDYSKHANDISPLRFQDPWKLPQNFFCDDRFWRAHQADWYESVIITKKTITADMKFIDWQHLHDLTPLLEKLLTPYIFVVMRKVYLIL